MRYWILFLATLFIQGTAIAQTSETAQKQKMARELMEVMGSTDELKKITSQMSTVIRQQLMTDLQRRAPQLNTVQLNRASDVMSKVISDEINISMSEMLPAMMQSFENLYATKFSLEELTELHRFMLSPIGRKNQSMVINELPQVMTPVMTQISNIAPRMAPKLQAAMKQLVDEGTLPKTP
jgi:hypothetical protein